MHTQTHVLSGWCLGNLVEFSPRERLFSMLAASLSDVDGLGILMGNDFYEPYHHKLAHNLFFGLLLSVMLAFFSTQRKKAFLVYLGLFHVHLVLDYFGSGPYWEIFYLWPFSHWGLLNRWAWPFISWQNISVGLAFIAWTLAIAVKAGRTPLEIIMPSLDTQLVVWLRARWGSLRKIISL